MNENSSVLDRKGASAFLHLADSTDPIACRSFGAATSTTGEVVFNTGMVGYPESLSDPSYRGQILVLTYPLIGNYGVPDSSVVDSHGLPLYFESSKIHVAGLVVSSYSWEHSHWAAKKSLSEWLTEHGIVGVYGVDTRSLTKKIREAGAVLGAITIGSTMPQDLKFEDPNKRNLVAEVSTKSMIVYGESNTPTVLAYDCGMKHNIVRYLVDVHKVKMVVVPYDYCS